MLLKQVMMALAICLLSTQIVLAEDYPALAAYKSLATELFVKTKVASSPEDLQSLQAETRKLIQVGVEIMRLYESKNPGCITQYSVFIQEIPYMESKTLEELHERYHDGTGLPSAPRHCYFGRSQVIHPAMNLVRLKGTLTDEVRGQAVEELEEVIRHLSRLQQNLDNPPLDPRLEKGKSALQSMTGCYLIDYSYTETESLKPDYVRDARVYDVNKDKSIKEWIYAEVVSPSHIRLQHILFGTDLQGNIMEGSFLKHQAEDWEYSARFLYNFTAPNTWEVKSLQAEGGLWTRRITNLDDGLRYQCAASWNEKTAYPEWSCSNYAPIPGRETRDMGRKDYNTLDRATRIIAYGSNWLERQTNTKVIYKDGERTPLAKELGKNWYVRLPDSECAAAQEFVKPKQAFWSLLRETWARVLIGDQTFIERPGQSPRFAQMFEVESEYASQDLTRPEVRASAEQKILELIQEYRAH